jgi:O-antigen/teichoic acid export membrane protein
MLLKNIRFGFEKKYVKELISFSFPIMLGGLILTLLNQSDRYILGFLVNSDEVGIYILGYNICGLINFLVISPFALAFTVISWNKLNETNAIRFYTKTITYLYFAVILCLIFVSLFTPHFIKIFTLNKNYWAAKNITPWIAFAMPFYGIHYITVFSFYVTKNTGYILLTYFLALSINVLLNIILIPYFSIYGAAIANFIGFFSLNYFFNLFSRKFYYIPIEWNKILKLNLTALLLIIPFFLSDIEFTILEILLKIFALFVFPFLLYLFGFYEKIELERMKSLFKSYSRRFCKSCSKF